MASPQAMGAYYQGYPDPNDPSTWGGADSFGEAKGNFETVNGPPPTPDPVPGPSSPGAGMAAGRIGDLCAHGGAVVGPGYPTVLIGNMVAVRAMPAMDQAACPMFNGPVPHATGTILKGSNTVLIGMMPAARVSDPIGPPTVCAGNQIAMGCTTVLIGDSGGGGGGGGAGGGGGGGSGSGGGGDGGAGGGGEAPPETTYADTQPSSQPPGPSTQNVGTGTHWIELEMVDEAEQPVAGESYVVRLTDGKERTGSLDERGQVRITGIKDPGACAIKFPNLDLAAWERWRPGSSQPPPAASSVAPPPAGSGQAGPVPQGPATTVGQWRRVLQGECVSSIAKDTGHFWSTIWDHPSNAELKRRRGDPNVLLPGDAVLVLPKRPKEDSGNTDQHYKFRRKGEPAALRLQVLDDDRPVANQPYELRIGQRVFTGSTDSEGKLQVPIPGNARQAYLVVGAEPDRLAYTLNLGEVEPIETLKGVQQRLRNLGYRLVPLDGNLDPQTEKAIREFQKSCGQTPTGQPDEQTRQTLKQKHGC